MALYNVAVKIKYVTNSQYHMKGIAIESLLPTVIHCHAAYACIIRIWLSLRLLLITDF
jgi:hypothetical protein